MAKELMLIGGGAALFGLLGVFSIQRGRAPTAEAPTPRPAPSRIGTESGSTHERIVVGDTPAAADAAQAPVTVRAYLSAHWGTRWPTVEAELSAARIDLDRPLPPDAVRPFEEVEGELHAGILDLAGQTLDAWIQDPDWPSELSHGWLCEQFRVDPLVVTDADVEQVREIAAEHARRIEQLGQQLRSGVDAALSAQWTSGRCAVAPLHSVGTPERQRTPLIVAAFGAGGWAAGTVLYEDEFPELADLRRQLHRTRAERSRAVSAYVKTLR